jgi:CBS domain containing-hemolysin-like protein
MQATLAFGEAWFGVCSAVMTVLILVLSEIIPKTIGTTYWKHLMGLAARTISVLIVLMWPIVKMIELISRLFPEPDEASVSREEVIAMANVGEEEGVIEEDENKIIRNLMRLNEVKAYEVMTPRVVAATASEKMTLKAYYDSDAYDHFSRIPVYNESQEFITGYVLRDDALEELTEDHFQKTLGEIKRPLLYFNEDANVGDIFDRMLQEKSQIGAVIDEYGCFQGILTLEDVIETIFGFEIIDEMDVVTDMQQYARERWQQRQKKYRVLSQKDSKTAETLSE